MLSTIEDLKNRRSIRKYKPEQIKPEELNAVLEAGIYAPTGGNTQSPIMVVIQDDATITKLAEMNAAVAGKVSKRFYGAPTVIVVLADREKPCHVYDGTLVMGNLMNAAHAIGLGSCWINRAKEVFDTEEGKAMLKSWGIEGDYEGIGNCILGYPDEDPAPWPRKEGYVIRV